MERPLREKEHRLKVPRNNLTFFSRLHSFPSFTRRSENKMFWHMPRPRNYIGLEWKCLYKTACPQPITLTIHKFRVRSKPNTFFLSHNRITSKFHPSFEGIHQISCRRRMERKIAFNLLIRSSGGIAQNILDCIIIRLELRMDYLLILPFRFAFILQSLDATVSRLLAETRKLLEDLEDVKCLDDIIDMLNSEIPIIHREWIHPITNSNKIPVEQGIMVS